VNVILFGPPGAGKGTQSDFITKSFNLHKVSTGDLLRNEVYKKTDIGNKIKSIMDKGIFVSNEIINDLIEKVLSIKKFYNRLIFDGYPRNLDQAKKFDILLKKYNQKITCVFRLNVDKKLIVKRILGRQTCTKCGNIFNEYFNHSTTKNHLCGTEFLVKRSDDNEETILYRYKTYVDETLPILEYYNKLNLLYEIDGSMEIDKIFNKISHIMASIEA